MLALMPKQAMQSGGYNSCFNRAVYRKISWHRNRLGGILAMLSAPGAQSLCFAAVVLPSGLASTLSGLVAWDKAMGSIVYDGERSGTSFVLGTEAVCLFDCSIF